MRRSVLILLIAVHVGRVVAAQSPSPAPEPVLVAAAKLQQPTPPPPPAPTPRTPQTPATPKTPSQPAPPKQPSPPPPPAPRREGQPINVRVEVTITDQQSGAAPSKKTVSVVVGDSLSGSVRTIAMFSGPAGPVPLNMDAEPTILSEGKIRLGLTLQYEMPSAVARGGNAGDDERRVMKTSISERLTLILENGKAVVAAQSADPVSDRQVALEVKATILR